MEVIKTGVESRRRQKIQARGIEKERNAANNEEGKRRCKGRRGRNGQE